MPQATAIMDLPELRGLAQGVLVTVAKEVLITQEYLSGAPERTRDSAVLANLSQALGDLSRKYDTLASLNLVYGGLDHFFALAQKELDAEKAKAAESASPEPTPAI